MGFQTPEQVVSGLIAASGAGGIAAGAAAPRNLTAPVVTGTAQEGEELSLSDGTWNGVQPITFQYYWIRDTSAIPGESGNTYTLVADDVGSVIKGVVTASNRDGRKAVASLATDTVIAGGE